MIPVTARPIVDRDLEGDPLGVPRNPGPPGGDWSVEDGLKGLG
ncbi:hypothetical protein [Natrinema versiforme]|nr:hypothetical protein [Natrinema versiforme]